GLAAVGLLSFPPAGYFTLLTTRNPLWKEVLGQFDNAGAFTPSLPHLVILLGLPFIVTLIYGLTSLISLRKTGNRQTENQGIQSGSQFSVLGSGFLWVWAVVGFGLLYIPTDFQIHMLNPYQVPLALLCARALWHWLGARRPTTDDRPPTIEDRGLRIED